MNGMLQGVRVLDQGSFITGPACAALLADLGADVIKVEPPGHGDPFRQGAGEPLYSPHFQAYNRNKRSIALDIRRDDDRQVFDDLVRTADVYIQNFRPGAADAMGAGAERLCALNPQLVYCSISGFGSSGPAVHRPAYDAIGQAMGGLLYLMTDPDEPRPMGPALADSLTGFYAAYGVLGALFERSRSGTGKVLEISMMNAVAHFNIDAFTQFFTAGEKLTPFTRPAGSQVFVLRCRDGHKLALHLSLPEKFWTGLIAATGRPELFADPAWKHRPARVQDHEKLRATLADIFKEHTLAQWQERLERHDVPYAPVYQPFEVLEDPQARHIGLEIACEHPTMGQFRSIRNPVRSPQDAEPRLKAPPVLDEHRQEILAELGRTASR